MNLKDKIPVLLIVLISLIAVSACAPDPRKQAEANAINERAQQDALNQIQQRQQAQDLHEITVQQEQLKQANRVAVNQEWVNGWKMTLHYGFYVLTFGLCLSLLVMAFSLSYTTAGTAKATVQLADFRSRMIPLDEATGRPRAFLHSIGKGRFLLVSPDINAAIELDSRSEPDRQLIAIMGAVATERTLAHFAAKSQHADSVAIIEPVVIRSEDYHE